MREGTAPLIRREDYAAPPFWIRKVDLTFDLDPAKTLVINRMQIERNADVAGRAAAACTARTSPDPLPGQRRVGVVPPRGRRARHRQPARRQLHARDPQHLRAGEEHPALGPLHLGRRLLHAVRGRGLSPHHLLPRPARRDGRVQRADPREQGGLSGAALERQPGRARRARQRPPLRPLARPLPQAELPVRAGRRPTWSRASSTSARARARTTCSRSTCATATSTRPSRR